MITKNKITYPDDFINRILQKDCLKVMKYIPDSSINLIVTDPPYNISGLSSGVVLHGREINTKDFGDWDRGGFEVKPVVKEFKRLLKPKGQIYIFTSEKLFVQYRLEMEKLKFHFRNLIVIEKCLHGRTPMFCKINGIVSVTFLRDLFRSNFLLNSKIELLSPSGNWVKVVQMKHNKNKVDGRIIYLRNGSKIKCTAEHKLRINGKFVKASKLKKKDILEWNQLQINENHNFLLRYDIGWMIGLFLAEGNYQKNNEIRFSLHIKETNFYKKLEILTQKYNGTIRKHPAKETKGMAVIINSNIIRGIMEEFIKDKGSHYKHLSSSCWNTNLNFLKGIFDGWLDGDGYCTVKNRDYEIGFTTNYLLDRDMRILANILGYSYTSKKRFVKAFGKTYQAIFARVKKYRTNHFNEKDDHIIKRIIKSKMQSYEISLEKNHQFLLADGIITHNSNPLPKIRQVSWRNATEYILYAGREKTEKCDYTFNWLGQQEMINVFKIPILGGEERHQFGYHPNQKPLKIIEKLIRVSSNRNDIILDPFLGSGTTALAAQNLGRRFIGIEIDPKYVQISKNRLKQKPML